MVHLDSPGLQSYTLLRTAGLRDKTTLMCGLITADSERQSQSNYALIILRELRSRRTLWKSVYPAAE